MTEAIERILRVTAKEWLGENYGGTTDPSVELG